MKKDITVGAKVGGVFGTGAFENLRVNFDFSVTYKDVETFPALEFQKDLNAQVRANTEAYQNLYKQMEFAEEQAKQKAIAKFHKSIRWYDAGNGLKYPSVTSVIDFANPIDWFVDDITYSYEMCQSRRAEYMYDWELKGDYSFVSMVRYICLPKGKIQIP